VLALCDTNGGMLPAQIGDVVAAVRDATVAGTAGGWGSTAQRHRLRRGQLPGCGRRRRCARAGTLNGYGERTGNGDLLTVVANLQLKRGRQVLETLRCARPPGSPTRSADHERPSLLPAAVCRRKCVRPQGRTARECDKGRPGPLSARRPDEVGNDMRLLVSDMAGRRRSS